MSKKDPEAAIRVLALVGSARKQGNTARMVALLQEELESILHDRKEPLIFTRLYLPDLDIRPCIGCRLCFDRGEASCPLKDQVQTIREWMDQADIVVFASPVYVDDVSGVMKNLLDRLAYLCHRPEMAGKLAWPIATSAVSPTRHTLRTLSAAALTWGFRLAGQTGLRMGALAPDTTMPDFRPATARAARCIVAVLDRQRRRQPSFLSLMIFRIQQLAWQREPPDSYDYQWWQSRGWLGGSCSYFVPHRAGWFKVRFARLAGRLIALFVS
ncbi:MAG: flavodoxin family protein [Spirochaetes bacterium]|nr:flavodoxin family protein [Spirochaetota bacterium]MBU0955155.1 flavodoxin family protein [Spirochaetota bacterium]